MSSLLLDPLPSSVEIDGTAWEIRSDFRTSIRFEELMQSGGQSEADRLLQALTLYYPALPHNLAAAVERMLWFYRCGETPEADAGPADGETDGPAYSFEHDADLIYAAFYAQYRIDLNADTLHWWKFKALFKGLHEDHAFVKIMGYRAVRITADMSKEQKAFYRRMKQLHQLPMPREKKKKLQDIESALLAGNAPEILE